MAQYKRHVKASFKVAMEEATLIKDRLTALAHIQAWADRELDDRRRKVTPETVARIREMRAAGSSAYVIGSELGLSLPTITRHLRRMKSD